MVPLASLPSEPELRELRAIAFETALCAMVDGWALNKFHGFKILAYSFSNLRGWSIGVVISHVNTGQTLSHEHLHRQGREDRAAGTGARA